MHEPVSGLNPVLVNHEVNMRGAVRVITGVDSGHLHHAIRVGVPTTTKPSHFAIDSIGVVPAIVASCIGWWENSGRKSSVRKTRGDSLCQMSTKARFIGVQVVVSMIPQCRRSFTPLFRQ